MKAKMIPISAETIVKILNISGTFKDEFSVWTTDGDIHLTDGFRILHPEDWLRDTIHDLKNNRRCAEIYNR